MILLAIAPLLIAASHQSAPAACYRFDQPYLYYYKDRGIDSTDTIALEQDRDTSEAPPVGAPDDAFPVHAPLNNAPLAEARAVLDRSWWRRRAADTIEIHWSSLKRVRLLRLRLSGDSAVGGFNDLNVGARLMGRPFRVRGVRVACPAMTHAPPSSYDIPGAGGPHQNIAYCLEGPGLVAAVIVNGPVFGFGSPEVRAAQQHRFDSLPTGGRRPYDAIFGTPAEMIDVDFLNRVAHVEGRSFPLPAKRQILAILVDLTDSVGGAPRIETRLIRHAPSDVKIDLSAPSASQVDEYDRILRLDPIVSRFLDRPE